MVSLHWPSYQRRCSQCLYVAIIRVHSILFAVNPCLVFYEFFISYLIAPGTFNTAHVVEVLSSLPDSVKYAGKAVLAAPFAFHSFNGIRHLGWDLLKCMSLFRSVDAFTQHPGSAQHKGCL
jgi:succinate dehydrogenase/fumarate reductase cytochrome b subunit